MLSKALVDYLEAGRRFVLLATERKAPVLRNIAVTQRDTSSASNSDHREFSAVLHTLRQMHRGTTGESAAMPTMPRPARNTPIRSLSVHSLLHLCRKLDAPPNALPTGGYVHLVIQPS